MSSRIIAQTTYILIVFVACCTPATAQQDVRFGAPGSYDIEFEPGGLRAAFMDDYDHNGTTIHLAWVAYMDPDTGLFQSTNGHDILIDTHLSSMERSFNGPEWGFTNNGEAAIYTTKDDANGVMQVYETRFHLPYVSTQITFEPEPRDCFANLPTQDRSIPEAYVAFGLRNLGSEEAGWTLADGTAPIDDELDDVGAGAFRWVPDSTLLLYPNDAGLHQQIALIDVSDHAPQPRVLTTDDGEKFDPYGFYAPEFHGEMLIVTTIGSSFRNTWELRVYRENQQGDWNTFASWDVRDYFGDENGPCEECRIFSVEPVGSSAELGDMSLFTVQVFRLGPNGQPFNRSYVFLLGMGSMPPYFQFVQQVDDGTPIWRQDAESWLGTNELFVYYTERTGNPATDRQLHRCRTGLFRQ